MHHKHPLCIAERSSNMKMWFEIFLYRVRAVPGGYREDFPDREGGSRTGRLPVKPSAKYLTLYSLAILIVVCIRTTIRIASEYRVRYFGLGQTGRVDTYAVGRMYTLGHDNLKVELRIFFPIITSH